MSVAAGVETREGGKKQGGDVADFLPEGKRRERNPQVQRGAAVPAPVPGRPSLP